MVYLRLIRVSQWVKNAFVFLPLFFNGSFLNVESLRLTVIAFISFCLASSAIYCVNDVKDAAQDRLHPKKCMRPVASGKIGVTEAIVTAMGLCAGALVVSGMLLPAGCIGVIILYLLLNLLYTFQLKRKPVIDMFVIAVGFVLRLWIDGIACEIELSPWIVSMTFLLMLFLAVAKRYDDVRLREEGVDVKRSSTKGYTLDFLRQMLGLLAAVTLVCYLMYTLSVETPKAEGGRYLYLTTIFVLYGIMRYLQITIVKCESGDPTEVVMKDGHILGALLCWILSFVYLLYFPYHVN